MEHEINISLGVLWPQAACQWFLSKFLAWETATDPFRTVAVLSQKRLVAWMHGATSGWLVQLRYASRSFNTPIAATPTEAAGCWLANWLEFAWKRLNPGLASAVII